MAATEDLHVTIATELAAALRDSVTSGEFPNVESALADAIATWSHRHEDTMNEIAWVQARISASIDDPRPSLSVKEVEAHMQVVFANARNRRDAAA